MAISIPEPGCKGLKMKNPQCGLCIRVCKQKALTFDTELQLDVEKCTDCGLCHGICPNLNFNLTGDNQQAVTEVEAQLKQGQGTIVVGCQPYGGFTCLGAISQENLFNWLSRGLQHLVVKHGNCGQCGRHGCALLQLRLERLEEFAGLFGKQFGFELTGLEDATPKERQTNRRQFFRQMARTTAGAVIAFKDLGAEEIAEAPTKQHIAQLRQGLMDGTAPFGYVLHTTGACEPCRICSAFCPHGALSLEQVELGQELRFDARLCTGCGFCLAACPKQALAVSEEPSSLGPKVLAHKHGRLKSRGYWE